MCDYCSWIDALLATAKMEADEAAAYKPPPRKDPVIIVHGGAGRIPEKERSYMMEEVKKAAIQSYTLLVRGCSTLDAVEGAVSHMESKKYFNCAWGGSVDVNGEVVMDAAIMDSGFNGGCIGAVRDIEHPISLARMVMHETDHVLIVERGAQKFALAMGMPAMPPGWLIPEATPLPSISSGGDEEGEEESGSMNRLGRYDPADYEDSKDTDWQTEHANLPIVERSRKIAQCMTKYKKEIQEGEEVCEPENEFEGGDKEMETLRIFQPTVLQVGAVGAVAYDRKGRLAAGTSTAGPPGKANGRMSPVATVLGCGVFADLGGCASVSGHEEGLYAYAPARKIVYRLNKAQNVEKSVKKELDNFEKEMFESTIGAIALDVDGKPAVDFRSLHFPWAYCELGRLYYGYRQGEQFSEKVEGLDRPQDCVCEGVI